MTSLSLDPEHKDTLNDIDERIDHLREKAGLNPEKNRESHFGATRVGVELVAATLVGLFLGFYVDKWLDTSPIFFIIGFLLGVAAGMINIYKMAVYQQNLRNAETDSTDKDNDK